MENYREFYQMLFRDLTPSDGYIEYRKFGNDRPIQKFTQDIDTLISATVNQTDLYYGVSIRREKKGTKDSALYSNVLFTDLDFHDYDQSSLPGLKSRAIEIIMSDIFLSQCSCIVDSGRGLHVYYLLPQKTFIDTLKNYNQKFIAYLKGIEFIGSDKILDSKVTTDVARVLRCPGSINSKVNTRAEILCLLKDRVIDDNFLKYLKSSSTPDKVVSSFSVKRAMELCGYEPTPGINVPCPFPDHNEEHGSFRYYPETDTFWCYGCSEQGNKKYCDGVHFLTKMGRPELIAQLKSETDIASADRYVLEEDGRMLLKTEKGDKLMCHFLSSGKIEAYSQTFGRKVYIDLMDSVVDITDYPTNREIKKRYLQANKEFLLNSGESGFADLLTRYIMKANSVDKSVIFNQGINHYEYGQPLFHFNGHTFPEQDIEPITTVEPLDTIRKRKKYNMDEFIRDLILDNNYGHIIGLMWGISILARDIIIDRAGLFPLMVATGIRESGKTQLARMIINMFGYDRSEEMDTTSFAMIKKLERYGTLPVHFDEFSQKKRETEHDELLKDLSTSKVSVRERGNISQKTDKYFLQCPVIITGEKNIGDAGIVSRAIILNLGKSPDKNHAAFLRWVDFYKSGKLCSFMMDFCEKHFYKFRNYFKTAEISRNRDGVKKSVVFLTLDYLEQMGLISKINRLPLESILLDTEVYKKSISSDGYTEILSDVLTENFDPEKGYQDYLVCKLMDSFFFNINDNVVFVNIPSLFDVYKIKVKDAMRKIPSVSEFKINFIQAPDMCGYTGSRKRIYIHDMSTDKEREKRLNEAIALRVSKYNYEYLRYVLLYKLLPKFTNNIEELYTTTDTILSQMQENSKAFVDTRVRYDVL